MIETNTGAGRHIMRRLKLSDAPAATFKARRALAPLCYSEGIAALKMFRAGKDTLEIAGAFDRHEAPILKALHLMRTIELRR